MWKALPAMPDRLTAGSYASVCATMLSGKHPDTGEFWLLFGPYLGGWGAEIIMIFERGQPPPRIQLQHPGGDHRSPPLRHQRLHTVSTPGGGHGQFPGGNGVYLDYRVTSERAALTAGVGRHKHPPWGVAGGDDGTCSYVKVIRRDGAEEIYGKISRIALHKDDLIGWRRPPAAAGARRRSASRRASARTCVPATSPPRWRARSMASPSRTISAQPRHRRRRQGAGRDPFTRV